MEIIGQLTGGVAHDFNNLLVGHPRQPDAVEKGDPGRPATSRAYWKARSQGAERGATLTKRLLAFARRQELKLEAVELQNLVPEMVDFLRQTIGHNIQIAIDIPAESCAGQG